MAIAHLLLLAFCACSQDERGTDRSQAPQPERKVELRVTFTTVSPPKGSADRKDAASPELALMLAMTSPPNKARTYMMERVLLKEGEAIEHPHRQVRKLEGTPYFAQLTLLGADQAAGKNGKGKETPPQPQAEDDGGADSKTPKKEEVPVDALRRIYFRLEIPAADFPKTFKATLTLRAGTRTFSARTYAYPFLGVEDVAFGRIETSLKEIGTAMDTAAFGRIPTLTVRISDDLDELAGLTANDPKGDKEYDRQWCQALCKRIERASYRGDDDVRTLVQQLELRLKRLKEGPATAPPPKDATPPEKPEAPKKEK